MLLLQQAADEACGDLGVGVGHAEPQYCYGRRRGSRSPEPLAAGTGQAGYLLMDFTGLDAYSGTPWKPVSRVLRISSALVDGGPLGCLPGAGSDGPFSATLSTSTRKRPFVP